MILLNQDNFKEIIHSLNKNKLRTSLTIIGIAWGMFLYIGLLGISKGMENGFTLIFDESSHNSIFLWGMKTSIPYKGFQRGTTVELTLSDTEEIKRRIKEIEILSPRNAKGVGGTPLVKVKNNNKSSSYKIFGDYPQIDKITKRTMISGRFLHHNDLVYKKRVCIIGEKVHQQLFAPNETYLGKYIQISGVPFKIVGMYKHTMMTEIEEDHSIFIPFSTFAQVFNTHNKVLSIAISLYDYAEPIETEQLIRKNLKEIKSISPNDNQAFTGINFGKEYLRFMKFMKGMEFLTIWVGILTLLSGVVSIGNILIISIKERTKEIGIKRAIGAKPAQIRFQIIMESLILTLFAGFIGFVFGVGFLALINFIVSKDPSFPFHNPTISIFSISLAFFVMVFFGILIGLIPAQKAIKIKPINAFRIE